jgi:5-methylcytosine-specific restriction enzyme A
MPLLYHWRREYYEADVRDGLPLALRQVSSSLHHIEGGESVWAFTRNNAGNYVLAMELVVAAKDTVPSAASDYGPYRVIGDPLRSRHFDVDAGNDVEPLIRSLGIQVDAKVLGHAFQGRAAVRLISGDDDARIREFATTLPTVGSKKTSGTRQRRTNLPDFRVGQTYSRRRDLHQQFGGQEQGGISTPANYPFIFLFTGESGNHHGYADGWTENGIFRYFGEGQIGPMRMRAGNRAIRDHVSNGRDLLLFETIGSGLVRFVGQFMCSGFAQENAPDRNGRSREAIVFYLEPFNTQQGDHEGNFPDSEIKIIDLAELRRRAMIAVQMPKETDPTQARRAYYVRSKIIREYVLRRAAGKCEACEHKAPFSMVDGTPYLEPHHIRRLSDGGPDDPRQMGAVCLNCHRQIHYGLGGAELNSSLLVKVSAKEKGL